MSLTDMLKRNRSDSLQPRPAEPVAQAAAVIADGLRDRKAFRKASLIATDRIEADPTQPRQVFDEGGIARLAESMAARGQLVPILVRWSQERDRFVVIDGERRYRAAVRAGLAEMAVVVESELDPATLLEIQLVTNALREDVGPMEQAQAWRRLIEAKGYTHAELAARLGYDRSTVTRNVGLTEAPVEIQEAVAVGAIVPQTGYELSRVKDPAEQAELLAKAKAGHLRRDDLKGRSKAKATRKGEGGKAKVATSRTFRFPGGLRIEATRARGLDPLALAESLRAAAAEVEAGGRQS